MSSCGVIAFSSGSSLSCEDFNDMKFSDLPEIVQEGFLMTNFNTGKVDIDYESIIIDLDNDFQSTIPVTVVIRCYGNNCSRENRNHKTNLRSGYHFEVDGEKYTLRCGNMRAPKIIFEGKLYSTEEYFFIFDLRLNKDVIFKVATLNS